MVVPTNVRAGRAAAIFLAFQSAKETAHGDFTAADAKRVWSTRAPIDFAPLKSDASGFASKAAMATEDSVEEPTARQGAIEMIMTPTSIEWALRSCWGPLSGGSYGLTTDINEWLTVALVEDVVAGSTQKFIRLFDAWIHRVTIETRRIGRGRGRLVIVAEYAAEQAAASQTLDALSGVTLPSPPMDVSDKDIFPSVLAQLFRDPAGTNDEIDLQELVLEIDQGLADEWDEMKGVPSVTKLGWPGPRVSFQFRARVGDETWALIEDAVAKTKRRYQIVLTSEASVAVTVDLYETELEVEEIGHRGRQYRELLARGVAHIDSSGNHVTIAQA